MNGSSALTVYALVVIYRGVRVRALFNDWVASRGFDPNGGSETIKINPMVLEGPNTLRLLARRCPESSDEPYVDLRLTVGPHGDAAAQKMVFRAVHTAAMFPRLDDHEIELASHRLDIKRAFGRWSWEDCAPFRNEEGADVLEALRRMHEALAAKDADRFVDLCSLKLDDLARSSARDPAEVAGLQRDVLRTFFEAPVFAIPPWDPSKIMLESAAGGRIVEAWREDYEAPLKVVLFEQPIEFEMSFAKINGVWRGVR